MIANRLVSTVKEFSFDDVYVTTLPGVDQYNQSAALMMYVALNIVGGGNLDNNRLYS